VVTYRRDRFPDDTVYNNAAAETDIGSPVNIKIPGISDMEAGFYYISPLYLNGD
jgi:hypothetical protein